jgi:hypothetical protein
MLQWIDMSAGEGIEATRNVFTDFRRSTGETRKHLF